MFVWLAGYFPHQDSHSHICTQKHMVVLLQNAHYCCTTVTDIGRYLHTAVELPKIKFHENSLRSSQIATYTRHNISDKLHSHASFITLSKGQLRIQRSLEVWTGPGSTNNIRVRVGPRSTDNIQVRVGCTGIFRAFSGHLSPKKKLFVITRNSWHSQNISAQGDLALLLLQTRKARGLGIPDLCQRDGKSYTMISWPLLTYSVWYYILDLDFLLGSARWMTPYIRYELLLYFWISCQSV
jgi:hypothetical protein